ncbi:MAG: iron ABC transporter permease [Aeriscardovia sp.]|nr:iron ABC transporter permease [Aeriscardovia sp.]
MQRTKKPAKTQERRKGRYLAGFLFLFFLLVLLIVVNLCSGSVAVPAKDIFSILLGRGEDMASSIILRIRLPRILAAILLGGALSVSGFLLQTFFHNPIAGPFILGISSGAKLFVAFAMISSLQWGRNLSAAEMVLSAFLGSMLSMSLVLLVSRKVRNMSMLVICGIMISYICSAATDFAVTFAEDSNIVNLHSWSLGSFSSSSWEEVKIAGGIVLLTLFFVFFLSKPIAAYQLGENYARSLGVPVGAFRAALILCSSILSACVTAFAGPVSFVGIAVPHLVKGILKSSKPLLMIPGCFLGGAAFCLFSDLIARCAFAPTELSISSVTAAFGAPVVIMLMIRRKREG